MEYEQFKSIIEQLKALSECQDGLYKFCRQFNKNNREELEISFPSAISICVELLEYIFDDATFDGWISYYIFELNYGKDYKPGMIVDKDGSEIELKTTRQLYDFLVGHN